MAWDTSTPLTAADEAALKALLRDVQEGLGVRLIDAEDRVVAASPDHALAWDTRVQLTAPTLDPADPDGPPLTPGTLLSGFNALLRLRGGRALRPDFAGIDPRPEARRAAFAGEERAQPKARRGWLRRG